MQVLASAHASDLVQVVLKSAHIGAVYESAERRGATVTTFANSVRTPCFCMNVSIVVF